MTTGGAVQRLAAGPRVMGVAARQCELHATVHYEIHCGSVFDLSITITCTTTSTWLRRCYHVQWVSFVRKALLRCDSLATGPYPDRRVRKACVKRTVYSRYYEPRIRCSSGSALQCIAMAYMLLYCMHCTALHCVQQYLHARLSVTVYRPCCHMSVYRLHTTLYTLQSDDISTNHKDQSAYFM